MSVTYFGAVDYSVFAVMLTLSALIGVYFAFFAKQKQNTIIEYLLGGRNMAVFPVAMSLVASDVSGISLLGIPSEVYLYGSQYSLYALAPLLDCLLTSVIFLPVYFELQITTSFEYLNLRFGSSARLMGTLFFLVNTMFYYPVVAYVPALAFNQVTGINIHVITLVISCVCIFYSSLGGLKAVVWVDTLQTILMFGAVIVVMVLGIIRVGSVQEVFERNRQSGRLEVFNMDLDPTVRYTFWTMLVGSTFSWLPNCTVSQAMMQRFLSMPTLRKSNYTVALLALGVSVVVLLCCFTGLVIHAVFQDCDPITTQTIGKPEQILPYFVMHASQALPGLPGLFAAGVFSASLSSMSTCLNTMTGVIFEDLIQPMVRTPFSEQRASTIMKVMAALLGFLCFGLVFVVEKLEGVLQTVLSLQSVISAPQLGIFLLGLCFPLANEKGALAGGLSGFAFTAWLSFSAQSYSSRGLITFPKKSLLVDGCPADVLNSTTFTPFRPTSDDVFWLYRVSYMYYTLIGLVVTLVVGLLVSWLTGQRDAREVPRELLTPLVRRLLPSRRSDTPMDELQEDKRFPPTPSSTWTS